MVRRLLLSLKKAKKSTWHCLQSESPTLSLWLRPRSKSVVHLLTPPPWSLLPLLRLLLTSTRHPLLRVTPPLRAILISLTASTGCCKRL
jgi:hypothetical protein